MVNMNMIVNASDLVGYEAENKKSKIESRKEILSKLVAAWEGKNAKSAKKIGTLGLLAVSLAACNNDDDSDASADLAAQLAAANAAVAAAEAAQAAAEAAAEAAAAPAAVAAVTQLTTSIDSVAPASTSDSLVAGLTAGVQTLQSLDSIDMGAGVDTLIAIVSTGVTPDISNVEHLNLSTSGAAAVAIDLSASSGVESVTNTSSAQILTINNMDLTTTMSLANNSVGATYNYKATAVVGTADAGTLTVSNVTGAAANVVTVGAGLETMNLVSNGGTTNTFNPAFNGTTLNITGATGVTLNNAINTTFTTIDASGSSGAITLTNAATAASTYTGSSGVDTLTVSGATGAATVNAGAGNDVITFTQNLIDTAGSADTLDGGDGTDTLVGIIGDLDGLTNTAASASVITNFENIRVSDTVNGHTLTTSSVQASGLVSIDLDVASTGAGTFNVGAGTTAITIGAPLGGQLNVNDHAVAATSVTLDDVLNLSSSSTAAQNIAGGDFMAGNNIALSGIEILNIDSTVLGTNAVAGEVDFGTIASTVDTGGTFTVNVTGSNKVDMDGAITANTINFSGMSGRTGTTAGDTVDMGTVRPAVPGLDNTVALTITGSPGSDVLIGDNTNPNTITDAAGNNTLTGGGLADTITGGSGNDTLAGGGGNDTLAGGAGNDSITGGAGNDTITGGEGNDSITPEAGTDNVSGGAGNDTVIYDTAGDLSNIDVVTGGDGTDTLSFTAQIVDDAAAFSTVSGFEIFDVSFGAIDTITMSNFTNNAFTTISYGVVGNSTATLNNVGASVTDVIITAAAAGEDYEFNRLVDSTTNAINITHSATGTISVTDLNFPNEETITVNSGALATDDVTYTNADFTDATSLTVTGLGDFIITNAPTGTLLASVDATGTSGAVTVLNSNAVVATSATGGSAALTYTGGMRVDTIEGGSAVDVLIGGAGNDIINGNGGADTTLSGGTGNDTINGGSGADTITGGAGTDVLTGGDSVSVDNFVFAVQDSGITVALADTITDFVTGVDTITTAEGNSTAPVDGSGVADLTAAIVLVDAVFTNGAGPDDIYVLYNALGSGDAYVFIDEDDDGDFSNTDDLIILTGINLASEIAATDFL
jgi:Ca2+-binding RTX toxin-like protein